MAQGAIISGEYRDPDTQSSIVYHYAVNTEGGPPWSTVNIVTIDERAREAPTALEFSIPWELLHMIVRETEDGMAGQGVL